MSADAPMKGYIPAIVGAGACIGLTYLTLPMYSSGELVTQHLVTIFSVLAGFMIAAISMLGEREAREAPGWKLGSIRLPAFFAALDKNTMLFEIYLAYLFLAVVRELVPKGTPANGTAEMREIIDAIALFLAFAGLMLTVRLPLRLADLVKARRLAEIKQDQASKTGGASPSSG